MRGRRHRSHDPAGQGRQMAGGVGRQTRPRAVGGTGRDAKDHGARALARALPAHASGAGESGKGFQDLLAQRHFHDGALAREAEPQGNGRPGRGASGHVDDAPVVEAVREIPCETEWPPSLSVGGEENGLRVLLEDLAEGLLDGASECRHEPCPPKAR
ncbi:MAG TPA: hypothetical protein ENK43_00055 [Planctomycetes bacterium]|nr:hypothetical protein [Planctomycetota bacterium]